MNNPTPEQLEMLERCGAALTKPKETSRLAGIQLDILSRALLDPEDLIYQSYFKGLENTRLELRERIIAIAKTGSSPAQTLAVSLMQELITELDD